MAKRSDIEAIREAESIFSGIKEDVAEGLTDSSKIPGIIIDLKGSVDLLLERNLTGAEKLMLNTLVTEMDAYEKSFELTE